MAADLKMSELFGGAGGNSRAGRTMRRALGEFPLLILLLVGLTFLFKLVAGIPSAAPPPGPGSGVLRYWLIGSPGYSETDLRTIQTWILERRLKAMPGVVDVTARAIGGAIDGCILLSGDRQAAEIEVDKLNRGGILPPGVRLEKVPAPSVNRGSRQERVAGSPGR